jgi:putative ABC transport system substrate-binding protein
VRAQQPKKPTIGFLGTTTTAAWSNWVAAFVQRLRDLGWIDGNTVTIEYRWADGRRERFAEIAAEFARLKVDVIVTSGGAGLSAKQATKTIPIVLAIANDPLADGLVTSLARPGGNITGLSLLAPDLAGKRLELFRESLAALRRMAILADPGYAPAGLEMADVFRLAHTAGVEASKIEIRRAEDIVPAIVPLKGITDALYVCGGPLVSTNRDRINTSALAAQLPTMHGVKEYVEAGGLMSYGPSYTDLFSRAGEYVDKILRGAKAGDIPIEQPTRFEFVINLKTANALGLTIAPTLLARADEVIE